MWALWVCATMGPMEPAIAPLEPAIEEPPPFSPTRSVLYGAGNVGAGMVFAFTNAALPFYLASYGLPNVVIGLLGQDRPPTAGLLQIVVGTLSDRTRTRLGRRRPYLLIGIPVAAAALLALGARPPLALMLPVLLLMTSFLAVGYGPYLALLPDLVPSAQRGRVGAVLGVGNMLGQLGLLYLASQLLPTGEGVLFAILACVLVLAFGLTCFGVREPSSVGVTARGQVRGPVDGATEGRPGRFREHLHELAGHTEVVKYVVATLFFWCGTGSVIPFLTRFGVNELGTDEGTAFRLLMLAIISTAAFTVPGGWLGDRYGKPRVFAAGLALYGVAILIGSQARTVEQAAAVLVVTGAANGIATALMFPLLSDLIPRERAGEFVGLGTAAWELAQPLGAALGGLGADLTGSLRTSLAAAGLLVLVSWLLVRRVRVPRAEPGPLPSAGS